MRLRGLSIPLPLSFAAKSAMKMRCFAVALLSKVKTDTCGARRVVTNNALWPALAMVNPSWLCTSQKFEVCSLALDDSFPLYSTPLSNYVFVGKQMECVDAYLTLIWSKYTLTLSRHYSLSKMILARFLPFPCSQFRFIDTDNNDMCYSFTFDGDQPEENETITLSDNSYDICTGGDKTCTPSNTFTVKYDLCPRLIFFFILIG